MKCSMKVLNYLYLKLLTLKAKLSIHYRILKYKIKIENLMVDLELEDIDTLDFEVETVYLEHRIEMLKEKLKSK